MRAAAGEYGELRVGWHKAASLAGWTMSALPVTGATEYSVEAVVTNENGYWITQGPFDLVLVLGPVEWTWRGVIVTRDGDKIMVPVASMPLVTRRR